MRDGWRGRGEDETSDTYRETDGAEFCCRFLFCKLIAAKDIGKAQANFPPGQYQSCLEIANPGFPVDVVAAAEGVAV